ncbi:transglycosylase domain-containing protein [Nocardioides sp.]|uniref:transglycosylase domain-containing protein n=1 Tax=Nocardioides sp. TaxID=35761 RepID=UPI0027289429|nr:transglycosylase domain-containing protein [Nocardioides sp.]MDO9454472.1 transglycosylase domain-containing protein [Nocardioides sp.]
MSRPRSERPRPTTVLSHFTVMLVVSVVLGVVVSGLAIPFAGLLGFAARSTADTTDDLPLELETESLPQKTTILASDGSVLATVFDQNRINVSLDQISRTMVQALVSIEDYRFYEHGALDVKGTLRALVSNVGSGGVVQGGSSITQQLVKQTLLNAAKTDEEEEAVTDDTYARKLKELRYAIALEKKYSKDWILERYLNTVYFGAGAYGIQAAAKRYFNVNARNLNLNQSAILAGLVQNPSAFDPTRARELAIARRDVVLDRMAELNVISQDKADAVKARRLKLRPSRPANGCVSSRAPFFCNYAIEYLLTQKSLGRNKAERDRLIRSGGLTIRTTIDLSDQKAADEAVAGNVRPTDQAIGALAMVEPGTGDVKAIAQSRPMGDKKRLGQTYLNYVVPSQYGDSNGFQAGSTFKAFVLAQAIENGTALDETLPSPNGPVEMEESDYENCDGPYGFGEFPIANSVSSGGVENLYTGTRNSINTFFLNLEKTTGICDPYALARSMGVRLTCPGEGDCPGVSAERVPFFTLGVADVSPLEMAEAYATFAGRGVHCESRPITSIEDANGNLLKKFNARCSKVMSTSTADAVNDILRGVIEGGFASAQALEVPAAGKTGTTGGSGVSPSVWFVGYTPQLATAAMIAGANEFGTPIGLDGLTINGSTVSASGSGLAAPMWGDAMKVIDDNLDPIDFEPADVEGFGQETVFVPRPPSSNNNNGGGRGRGRGGRGR